MKQLFAPDSKLMIFLGVVKDLMFLGVIFIVTALPVITFGAAMTALQYTALKLARDIANKIEATMSYPGVIKVNVIRETRAVEYAK